MKVQHAFMPLQAAEEAAPVEQSVLAVGCLVGCLVGCFVVGCLVVGCLVGGGVVGCLVVGCLVGGGVVGWLVGCLVGGGVGLGQGKHMLLVIN
jgi:hypothetical protein